MNYFLLLIILIFTSCATHTEQQSEAEVPKIIDAKNYDQINTSAFLTQNLETCFDQKSITQTNGYPNWSSGDFNQDGIKEIVVLLNKDETVNLTIIHRDENGICTDRFESKNWTTKILEGKTVRVQSSSSTRLASPGKVNTNINFSYRS